MPRNHIPACRKHAEHARSCNGIHGPVTSPGSQRGPRIPWRPLGTTIASLGAPAGIGLLHPRFGEVLTVIEAAVAITIIVTAVYGSTTISDRAFRLLRWISNQPEPPAPGSTKEAADGISSPGG